MLLRLRDPMRELRSRDQANRPGTHPRPMGVGMTAGNSRSTHVHVQPVPPGMTPEEAFAETCTLGRLAPYRGEPTWATLECAEGACDGIQRARDWRRYHNDRLVDAAGLLGVLVRRWRRWMP